MIKTKAQTDAENLTRTLHKAVREYEKLSGGISSPSNTDLKAISKNLVSRYRGGGGT